MRVLTILATVLAPLIGVVSLIEYMLPLTQFTKVLSELKVTGITDHNLIANVRHAILGVRGTFWYLFALIAIQVMVLVAMCVQVGRSRLGSRHTAEPVVRENAG